MLFDYPFALPLHPLSIVLFLPFLYAEIHYRIRGLFSRYDQQEPEIIADVPHRLEPGQPLPVLLLIKDANRYPIHLLQVRVTLHHNNKTLELANIQPEPELVNTPFWSRVYTLALPAPTVIPALVDVHITIENNGRRKTITNDNYKLTSHKPFTVCADTHPLPRNDNWYFGDLHYHSNYSSDQVEFGAPLEDTATIARAMGLDFLAVTDHSYDLDDFFNDYLHNDPALAKWHDYRARIDTINKNNSNFVILPGEELSAGNAANRNVHFLLLNSSVFFPGSGDSAEIWFKTQPEMSIAGVLQQLEPSALAIAAHPEDKPPFLQWLLIRRGKWQNKDYGQPGLHGVQMWNGRKRHFLRYGLPKWIWLLLHERRLILFAGNDAHGNFNRFRQLSTPFLTMREHDEEIFAGVRTGVFLDKKLTPNTLASALRSGRVIVTDGPFAEFSITDDNRNTTYPGDDYYQKNGTIHITAKSTPGYGNLLKLELLAGDCEIKKETCLLSLQPETGCFEIEMSKELQNLPPRGYLRLAVISQTDKQHYHCFTNPLYLVRD